MNHNYQGAKKSKILIVDDQIDNLRLLSEILTGRGYEVRKAINGSTALMGVQKFPPDLILLDINMPGLNGYEVCQKLKSDRQTSQIPIIFLSASDRVIDKVKSFEVGGVDYITKPFQVPEVLARVENQIKIRRFSQMRESLSKAIVHDLKNPLSVITFNSSSLIRRGCLQGKNLKALQSINDTAQRLDSMIDDLLIAAKMDADRLILHRTEIDLKDLILDILKRLQAVAEVKQISLIHDMAEENKLISVDVNLFQRVIENLLSNAIKFSPVNSSITLGVNYDRASDINNSTVQAIVQVIDEGIGIKPELHQKIFEPYNIGEYVDNVNQIGLGLSFCKMVIEAHGGRIFVANNQPQGAIFTVEV